MRIVAWTLVLLLSGCASIPSSGPIERVDETTIGDSSTRFIPAGPKAGDSPSQIVQGFIEAMLAFPVDTTIASSFLSKQAAEQWKPAAKTIVYDSQLIKSADDGERMANVTAQFFRSGVLDEQGRYRAAEGSFDHRFRLIQVEGEWRIDNAPVGRYVTKRFFVDHYTIQSLYFFDSSGRNLVPDPLHVVSFETMPTQLITSLFAGPKTAREAEVQSFLREDISLRGVVEISQGTAEVRLRQTFGSFEDPDRAAVQIAATLLPLEGINRVAIIAPDGEREITNINEYQPSSLSDVVYALDSNRVVRIKAGNPEPVPGLNRVRAESFAAHDSGQLFAVVNPAGNRVDLLEPGKTELLATIEAETVVSIFFDERKQLWVVDKPGRFARIRIRVLDEMRVVRSSDLHQFSIQSLSLSPDGARYAMVAFDASGGSLHIGAVSRDADGQAISLQKPVQVEVGDVSSLKDARWIDSIHVSVVANIGSSGPQALVVAMDGSLQTDSQRPSLPSNDATTAVQMGLGNEPVYVGTKAGVWALEPDQPWRLLRGLIAPTRAR